ncbi:unnamed protein product [Taenia asiatica]|uniref:Anaphase-promoting complex subunit 1 n=1 Tax=Taenia asiatica TaxID=60517 RepID=A0A0R3WCW4_TAEAS|nr:unnamed protein product [Taenia asiatica]
MSICRNDGQHSPITPTFTFWPHYDEEEDNEEKRTVFFSYRAQSTTTTPTRTTDGNAKKTASYKSYQSKVVHKGGRGLVGLTTPAISTASTLTSSHKRPTDRPSALVSPLTSLERSRGNNVRVSHLRLNPATVGAPRSLLKKPPSPLPPPPSPQLTPRQKLHQYPQPYAHTTQNAMACSALYLQPTSTTSNKKSYTSSIHVHVSPVASPITLDLREPSYEPNATSTSTSIAIPQSSEPYDSYPRRTHHLFSSSHCPFNFRYKELQDMEGVMFPPSPTQSTALPVEEGAFTDTEVPLPSPRITLESLDERHVEFVTGTKECAVWKNTFDILANEVTMSKPREEVFTFMLSGGNATRQSKGMTNGTASLSRLRVVSLREGRACEIVRPFSSFSSLVPLESLQKATLSLYDSTSWRAVDRTPRILLHESVVRHTPSSHLLIELVAGNSRDLHVPSPGPQLFMPPDRITTPTSPYIPDDTVYFEALGNHSNAFRPEWSTPLETETEPGAFSPLASETKLTPKETIERINKLRSIIRVDERFYPLQVDKCIQVEQPARRTLASWQTSKECQADQLPSDLWDTATVSDTSTQSFNGHSVATANIVEDYGDCEPLLSCRSRPRPQENVPLPLLTAWREQRLRKPSTKSVRRRRRTKVPALRMEDVGEELTSGAPFITSRPGRSMSVEEGRCPPPSEQGSPFSINESSPPISTLRWEECINRVYARRRHHSTSSNAHVRSSRPKRTSRKLCTTDRKKQQDLRCSLMRQTFASAQRCKASHPS